MSDLLKETMTRLARAIERDTRKLLEDAIAKRLGVPVVKFENYLVRMRTDKAAGGTLVYLDTKPLILIRCEYFRKGLEIGYNITHFNFEAPNVH